MGAGSDLPPDRTDEPPSIPSETIDPSLVASLYLDHGQELRRFVLGVVRDPELAADVVQATFAKVVELGHTARAETLKAWLFRVAFHEALTARRRQTTRDQARGRWLERHRGEHQGPEESLIRGETVEAVRKVLERLPPEQRQVVLARMYEDKTFAQIARESGVPLGTVLTRMRRALDRLRDALGAGDS